MKKYFKQILFCVIFFSGFLVCQNALAADYYIAQTAAGLENGSDCANADALVDLTWGTGNNVAAGDTLHLCGTISTALTVQGSGAIGNLITIKFELGAKLSAPVFQANTGNHTGGAILISGKNYIVIDGGTDGIIENTDTGSKGVFTYYRVDGTDNNIDGTVGVFVYNSDNVEVKNLNIRNLFQAQNNEQPNLMSSYAICVNSSSNIHVHNNTVDYAPYGVGVAFYSDSNVEVDNNAITRIGAGVFVGIGNAGETGDDVKIHDNRISDTTPWSYNDGIKIFGVPSTKDPLTNVKIYNNIIGPAISHSADDHPATAWILVDQGWIVGPEIYNNVLIGDSNDNAANAYITVGGAASAYGLGIIEQNAKIYNNTIVSSFASPDIGIIVGKQSIGNQIYNNVFKFTGNLIALYINDSDSEIADSNNNNYYTSGTLSFYDNGISTSYNLANWKTTTGFENNSITTDPSLDVNYNPSGASSPIVNTGKDLSATFTTDLDGNSRPQGVAWDIGAYEYGASIGDTIPPASPSGLSVS